MPAPPLRPAGWRARLDLKFAARRARTVLVRFAHEGPLRVQKPFYPEGAEGSCHVYLLHPPGGVVATDRLDVSAAVGAGCVGLVTTPGAGKLYRSIGGRARVAQQLDVSHGGLLEWLPQETIAFNGADAQLTTRVDLSAGGRYFGWELLCLGRPAAREAFDYGCVRQRIELHSDGALQWLDSTRLEGGSAVLGARWGLAGHPVVGTLVCAPGDPAWLDAAREAVADVDAAFGFTVVRGVLVGRVIAADSALARAGFERAWQALRPLYAGREAVRPRVWNT